MSSENTAGKGKFGVVGGRAVAIPLSSQWVSSKGNSLGFPHAPEAG